MLDHLYGSIYATQDHLQIEGDLDGASTYVFRQRGDIKALLFFRREHGIATVLNQLIALDGAELQRFAATLFASDASLSAISLTAIQTGTSDLLYPYQRFRFTEDIVAPLPHSPDAFLSRLGPNTRETVKRYTSKVRRLFPSFRFEIYTDRDIDPRHARDLLRLHQARMLAKNKHSDIDEREFGNILELARRRGMMTVALIDDRICGGLICWRVDRQYFMRIIAHDPRYDSYKLGSVCCYLSMRECIAREGTAFHFLFGRVPYKYRFLGEAKGFDQIVIYRSYTGMARACRLAGRTAMSGMNREIRFWLQDAENKSDLLSRAAVSVAGTWHSARSLLMRG
jgi:hypothetical protein